MASVAALQHLTNKVVLPVRPVKKIRSPLGATRSSVIRVTRISTDEELLWSRFSSRETSRDL